MERYLDRCLSSLVVQEKQQALLEVVVIIDGATDGSLKIAQQYAARYPDTYRIIEKENGNYGSCINRGLQEAHGEYVKIVDADDWLDNDVLESFLDDLSRMVYGPPVSTVRESGSGGAEVACRPDVIQTPFTCYERNGLREVVRYNTMGREPYAYGKVYLLDDILADGHIRFFLMHGLAYRTGMLREQGYEQSEGLSYTDTQWSCYPFYKARTIVFLNRNLYQYDNTRDGQTMDETVLMSGLCQLQRVTDLMVEYYEQHIDDAGTSDVRKAWMKQYHTNRIRVLYKHYLLDMPRKDFDAMELEVMDRHYQEVCRRNDFDVVLFPENRLVRIDCLRYWHRHHRRLPVWLERFNRSLDMAARFLYVKIIRR